MQIKNHICIPNFYLITQQFLSRNLVNVLMEAQIKVKAFTHHVLKKIQINIKTLSSTTNKAITICHKSEEGYIKKL